MTASCTSPKITSANTESRNTAIIEARFPRKRGAQRWDAHLVEVSTGAATSLALHAVWRHSAVSSEADFCGITRAATL